MIILRQHNYTFADQRVLAELKKATKGFMDLPKGWEKNLTTRDIYRLENMFGKGEKRISVDPDELRIIATHLGLPETAKHGKHFLEKLEKDDVSERAKNIRMIRIKKNSNKFSRKLAEIKENITEISPLFGSIPTGFIKKGFIDKVKGLSNEDAELLKQLKRNIRKDKEVTMEPFSNYKKVDKAGYYCAGGELNSAFDPKTGKIYSGKLWKNSYPVLGHEWGHKKWESRHRLPNTNSLNESYERRGNNIFHNLPSEAGASLTSLVELKKAGATPKQLEKAKQLLGDAFKSYVKGTANRVEYQARTGIDFA